MDNVSGKHKAGHDDCHAEGPNSYHGIKPPSKTELGAPVKIYPGSHSLGKGDEHAGIIEGPCSEHGKAYHK